MDGARSGTGGGQVEPSGRVRGREWAALLTVALALAALSDLPRLLARIAPPFRMQAVYPTVIAAHDYPQYLGAIRDSAGSGSLRTVNHFSTEPHEPVVIRPFYAGLGIVSRLTGLAPETAYGAAACVGRLFVCLALYLFAAVFFECPRQRWLAFGLVLAVSGLSWCLGPIERLVPDALLARYSVGIERSEYSTLLTLLHHPHLTIGLGLVLLGARLVIRALAAPRVGLAVRLGVVIFLISGINLFSLVTIGVPVIVLFVLESIRKRRVPIRCFLPVGLAGLAGVPLLVYAQAVFRGDSFWSATYGSAIGQDSPALDVVLVHLLPMVGLAALGASRFFGPLVCRGGAAMAHGTGGQQRAAGLRMAGVWIVVSFALMYLPFVQFQMRVALGTHPFLGMPAAAGVCFVWEKLRSWPGRAAVFVPLAGVCLVPACLFGALLLRSIKGEFKPDLLYRYEAEVDAAGWLRENTGPADRVMCAMESGNYLGGQIAGRVFVGHDTGTLEAGRKQQAVAWFFAGDARPEEKKAFLEERGITYVFFGSYEQSRSSAASVEGFAKFLEPAYEKRVVGDQRVMILRVRQSTGG